MEPLSDNCQKMEPGCQVVFFSPKSTSAAPNRLNMLLARSPGNLRQNREGHIFAISRDLVTSPKIAIFKTCSDSLNTGHVCSVLMPVETLQSWESFKMTL